MKEIQLYKSRWKSLKLMAGCALFVALGCFLLRQPTASPFMAWLCIVFFGLGLPLGLYQLLDRRPQIIINEIGIFDRTTHHEFINWELVEEVYLAEIQKQPFICLVVDEAFEPSRKQGKFRQKLARLNKKFGFQELNISLGNINIDVKRLARFIIAMRGAELPERVMLVRKGIDRQ